MAKQVKLAATIRTELGRNAVKKIKTQGFIPAVIYAHNEAPISLSVSDRDIRTVLAHAVGEHLLVDLDITGAENRMAIIQEVQHHPVTQRILHVDFHGVSANEAIESSVPLEPVGESIGVKGYGGLLAQHVHEITVKCLPANLPEVISVDISALNIGDSLHIKDIKFPEGVTAVDEPETTVFIIAEPKVAVEAVAGTVAAAPEVIKEKKPVAAAEKK